MKKTILTILGIACLAGSVSAVSIQILNHSHSEEEINHGGRTNSSGCHNDHSNGTYHCH